MKCLITTTYKFLCCNCGRSVGVKAWVTDDELPISDMIAIPDFSSGAMENWGLITYRETALLYNKGVSSESNKQRVAVVVSHELAHQVGRE